jgi:hypothetical protein
VDVEKEETEEEGRQMEAQLKEGKVEEEELPYPG